MKQKLIKIDRERERGKRERKGKRETDNEWVCERKKKEFKIEMEKSSEK